MKTATLPSLRVDLELRKAVENVLQQGESLSSFMEQSLRANIERRQLQQAFLARGFASKEEAKLTGEYFSAEDVIHDLDVMLTDSEHKAER